MKFTHAKTTLAAALLLLGTATVSAAEMTDTTREQRMDQALKDYRGQRSPDYRDSRNKQPGRFARGEESVKRGAHKTSEAVKRGAKKVGGAVETGATKTRDAIRNTGEKIESKLPPKPQP